ncbi:MAG: radical SAM protein [Dehalococcoidales bacterium]|nr:radical SAM protein [Dehalococcoidales bacterium]
MISFSRLLCDAIGPMDTLRYNEAGSHRVRKVIPRPVLVWNCTRQCNLVCRHCYASADNRKRPGEMDTATAKQFITGAAEFGVPVLMFSGGEPLLRHDFFELAHFAKDKGLRLVISTNGTKIDEAAAKKIAEIGFAEVGISLDGIGDINDQFRGKKGAFDAALAGMRNCLARDVRVSLRIVVTHFNHEEIPGIFKLVEKEGIKRVCFYHLAYAGRGGQMQAEDMSHAETRHVIDTICRETFDMYKKGNPREILSVGNHADGVYMYLKLKAQDPERAEKVLALLETNGGNNSGEMIGSVDDLGNVHPDQFWWHYNVGNVKDNKFGDIWSNDSEPMLHDLRNRRQLLKGRCSRCKYLSLCNGNLRVRAEARGDLWGDDPACYLTDEEIGLCS